MSAFTKLRVKETYFADPIKDEASVATASWELMPFTYREDVIEIKEDEPEEDALYSHELDIPMEVEYEGKGLTVVGSFIKTNREDLAKMINGTLKDNKFYKSASILKLKKAIKFVCYDDSEIIVLNASGYVTTNLGLGKKSVVKFPFKFRCLPASREWDKDIIM